MPEGKQAGVRCVQLSVENRCKLFASPDRPSVCSSFGAAPDVCGVSRNEALQLLETLEKATNCTSLHAIGLRWKDLKNY